MTPADIAAALLRTTLATSAAALAAWALLAWLRIDAPRIHRLAWLLVIAQGWLFFPLTIEIETESPPTTTKRAAGLVPAGITERSSTPLSADSARGREHFATSDSPIVEAPQSQQAPDPLTLPIIAIASWLLGAITLAAIAVYRYWQVLRTLPLGSLPDDPQWQAEWHAARTAAQLRRRQPVDLRVTTSLGPLLHWAPWAYLILVPRPLWTALAAPQRQAILRHELAHLRRGDLWKSLAIRVLALPQWFNPLARLAIRRFDEAAEWACDDAAAATAASRLKFAESLLQSAEYAVAPFPASAPAARGVLTRRIHRLVSPRFKEESKMKLLAPPLLLLLLAMFQALRIERVVAAETPEESPASRSWSLAEEFSIPLAERLENTKRRHAQLIAERQRHLDAAKSSNLPAASAASHSGPPLSQDQIDFDRLTKEFASFARMSYVIEPPDVVSIRISIRLSEREGPEGPLTDIELPRFKVAECLDKAPRRYVVGMDGYVRLNKVTSVYIAGMTLREAEDAIQAKLAPQGMEVGVRLSVAQFNSKVYYVITKGAALGDDVTRLPIPFPVDGKENVAEALARAYDNADRKLKLSELASASLTLHRPAPNGVGGERVYPIVWDPATQAPTPLTNHGILPGDRIFVELTPAAALPKKSYSVTDATGREFIIEPRFLPNVRDFRKSKPNGAAGGNEDGTNSSTPKAHTTDQAAYRLQPYDTIKLRVARPHRPAHALTWGDLEGEFTLSRDGSIYLGDDLELAQLAGMTSEEACAAIERQLREATPECKTTLELGPLASEKYFVSIQRPDGTEVAAGAMPVDASAPASMHLGSLRHWLGTAFKEADWELAEPADSNGRKAYLPGPGDRLVIKVRADAELGLLESPPSRPNYRVTVPPPMWIEVFGKKTRGFRIAPLPGWRELYNTQFDHPDVQRPAGPKYAR